MVLLCEVSNAIYAQDMEFSRLAGTLVGIGMSRGKPLSITAAASGTLVQKELQIVDRSWTTVRMPLIFSISAQEGS